MSFYYRRHIEIPREVSWYYRELQTGTWLSRPDSEDVNFFKNYIESRVLECEGSSVVSTLPAEALADPSVGHKFKLVRVLGNLSSGPPLLLPEFGFNYGTY